MNNPLSVDTLNLKIIFIDIRMWTTACEAVQKWAGTDSVRLFETLSTHFRVKDQEWSKYLQ